MMYWERSWVCCRRRLLLLLLLLLLQLAHLLLLLLPGHRWMVVHSVAAMAVQEQGGCHLQHMNKHAQMMWIRLLC
jgi:hypothetical protein